MTVSNYHVNTACSSFVHIFIHLLFIEHLLYVRHYSKHEQNSQSLAIWVGNQTTNKINK